MEYSINIPLLTRIMSFVKFDPWTPKMELNSFMTKPLHLCKQSIVYFIQIILYLNIIHNLKFDDSYLINNLSKWKNEKLIHKFPSIMYTNVCVCVCVCVCELFQKKERWILLLNNISMTILWKKNSDTWFHYKKRCPLYAKWFH
jgi:hypothetical protein